MERGSPTRSTSAVVTRLICPSVSLHSGGLRLGQPRSVELAAGAGLAPATSLSKSAELLITPSRKGEPRNTRNTRKNFGVRVFGVVRGFSHLNWWPARVTRPVLRIKSPLHHFNACRPEWCSRQDLHLHWRRSRRRASALGYASIRRRRDLNCLGDFKWCARPVTLRNPALI